MTVMEILQKRKELYENELKKRYITQERKTDTVCRLSELENLIFIVTTGKIESVK